MNNEQIQKKLLELEARIQSLEDSGKISQKTPSSAVAKSLSLREFMNDKSPKTANDQGLTIGYYLENTMGYKSFSGDDLKEAFRKAKIVPPRNINDMVNKNITKGYIMDAEGQKKGRKSWVLTATGENIVEKGFTPEE